MGGTNETDNLIDLFAREHFVAHKLLAKENPNEKKLVFAWSLISKIHKDDKIFEITPEEYEEARISYNQMRKGKPFSEEHRRKIGLANKGKVRTEEVRKQMSLRSSHPLSEEHRKKISNSMSGEKHPLFGKHFSQESKRKMSEKRKGKYMGSENSRALPIVQFDKNDNVIAVWEYIKEASMELCIDRSDITACAKGRLKSAGGYHWRYLYDNQSKDGSVTLGAISLGLISEEDIFNLLVKKIS